MASLHRSHVGWLGLVLAALSAVSGCAEPARGSARPGELELRVEPGAAYGVIGRFHLIGAEPGAAGRDIDFDAATPTQRVALDPGAYVLTLHAGARLVCREANGVHRGDALESQRLVSAWPQRINIAPGGLTTARIGFGAAPAPTSVAPAAAPVADPCVSSALVEGAQQALLSR
jgi:hypothetical protein